MDLIGKLEFGEASSDTDFTNKASELNRWILKIQQHVQLMDGKYSKLENMDAEERINYKLFMMYAMNSLCWIQLRTQGVDPGSHPVKQQLLRIRQLMQKKDQVLERQQRPLLDKGAAKRFIRSGLWDPNNKQIINGQPNKKIKFTES